METVPSEFSYWKQHTGRKSALYLPLTVRKTAGLVLLPQLCLKGSLYFSLEIGIVSDLSKYCQGDHQSALLPVQQHLPLVSHDIIQHG